MPTVKPQPTPTPSIMDQTFAHKTVPGATPQPVRYYIQIPDDVIDISIFCQQFRDIAMDQVSFIFSPTLWLPPDSPLPPIQLN